jgi:hypothetical protein
VCQVMECQFVHVHALARQGKEGKPQGQVGLEGGADLSILVVC